MKKYIILFAILTGMILLAFEALPALQASAQSKCGDPANPCSPPPNPGSSGSSGGSEKPGPKNHPTAVPTRVIFIAPTLPLIENTVVPNNILPNTITHAPYPLPYPHLYPTIPPHLPSQYLCQIGPCWPFGIQPGDPVELLAGGGFIVFLFVLGFVLTRGRNTPGGGGGSIQ